MQVALALNGVIYNIIEVESVATAQALFPNAIAFEATGVSIGWVYLNDEWAEPTPIEPEPPLSVAEPPKLIACAMRVPVVEGEVQQVKGSYKIAAMMLLDTGTFLAVFSENLGESEPFLSSNNGMCVSVAEWGQEYAIVEVRNTEDGPPVTPTAFGFSLYNF